MRPANLIAGGIGLRLALANLKLPEKVDEMLGEVESQARGSIASIGAVDRRIVDLQDGPGGARQ